MLEPQRPGHGEEGDLPDPLSSVSSLEELFAGPIVVCKRAGGFISGADRPEPDAATLQFEVAF